MTSESENPNPHARLLARRLRIAAAIIFLLGILGAEAVYWHATRKSDDSAILGQLGDNKNQTRQAQALYGNSNVALQEWADRIERNPAEQAAIIFGFAATLAVVSLFLAHHVSQD